MEDQSSSGIIVSTGAGSSAWFKSVVTGALGVVRCAVAGAGALPAAFDTRFEWSSDFLRFAVREPFPSRSSEAGIVFGTVTARAPLRVESHMPDGGVIFSDGVASDAVAFNSGAVAEVAVAPRKAVLVSL